MQEYNQEHEEWVGQGLYWKESLNTLGLQFFFHAE
jgi:hypothetical protein